MSTSTKKNQDQPDNIKDISLNDNQKLECLEQDHSNESSIIIDSKVNNDGLPILN